MSKSDKSVEFIFDFASPNAYLSHRLIPQIESRCDVKFIYRPCLLGGIFKLTGNRSPMEAFGQVKGKLAYEQRETQRFVTRHALTQYQRNPHFPVMSLAMMRGAVYAEQQGQLMPYVEAMMYHMWEAPKKMDDPQVLAAALTESGFDAQAFATGMSDQAVKDQLVANTNDAVERGVFGIPSFFIGDEMWFGKERLADIEAVLLDK